MKWNELDPKLRILYNAVVDAHTATNATTAANASKKALEIMEELTIELKGKKNVKE